MTLPEVSRHQTKMQPLLAVSAVKAEPVTASVVGVAAKGAPAFELAAQAGAEVRFDAERGYAVECDDQGRAGEGVWAVGECTGMDFDVAEIKAAAERCARAIAD